LKTLPAPSVACAAAAIAAWFLYFAHGGLSAPLSADDLMNLYGYLQKSGATLALDILRFWSTAYRPLGALFYVPLYRAFGVNPLPYRVVCFTVLGVNLVLLYRFCAQLTNSREIAFLGTLLASYHAWFVDLYYSAGTIYDLLCYALYMTAFLGYVRIRARGEAPRVRALLGLGVVYVLALDAKEMAVTLPLMILLYECIFHGPRLRNPQAVLVTGAITLVYVAGKLTGPGSLVENPRYALSISPGRFLDTFHLYLNPLFYRDHTFHDSNTVQLLIGMLALALLLRSRALVFAWCWLLLTILPVSFIDHYAEFFEYLPAAGWALYLAILLVMARRAVVGWMPRSTVLVRASQALLFAGLGCFLAPLHAREAPKTLAHFTSVEPPSREIAEDLARLRPTLRHNARVLYVDDPFPNDPYFLVFETRLYYRDMAIDVERTRAGLTAEYSGYDAVFGFKGNRLVLLRSHS
jgi:hypothetical protein